MTTESLDNAMIDSVIEHMNEDHADACLAIVQAMGNQPGSCHARMQSMDANGIDFLVTRDDGADHIARVPFDKPIGRDSQIRGHLVAMTKRARAILEDGQA